jgi:hypothetical protein
MKNKSRAAASAARVALTDAKLHGDEAIDTPIGPIELNDSYFDDAASKRLYDEMDYQRAAQAYIWSMPLVSVTTWRDNEGKAYGVKDASDFVVLESLKEKRGIVTANLTTPYTFNFSNLKDGPIRIDYPPGQTAGGVLDFWQRPVFDLGLTGPDQGKGATYIVVGPDDDPAKHKKHGANVFQSATNNVSIGLRILNQDPAFYETFTKSYRMGRAGAEMKPSRFIRGKDVEWSATAPRGLDYRRKLSEIIQEEPVREIDKGWMAMMNRLASPRASRSSPTTACMQSF